jgi:hypothetical protein
MRKMNGTALVGLLVLAGCTGADTDGPSGEQAAFWESLKGLCGQAFEGRVVETPSTVDLERLRMHVRECGEDEIRIPFHVGDDHSRTWVVTRTDTGLRLKHDHRLPDGTPDASNTEYGGDARGPGSVLRQEFPADEYSIGVEPARASQFWYLEIQPGRTFVYGLLREATGLRYRYEFDLSETIAEPPPPWGSGAE